jgi:MFS family permease
MLWCVGFLAFALMLWVLALLPPILAVVGAIFLSGVIGGPVNPLSVTIRQERIPPELRGRVFSTFSAIAMAASPFGIIAAGVLTEWHGLPMTLVVLASCYTLVCIGMCSLPVLHQMDRPVIDEAGSGRSM